MIYSIFNYLFVSSAVLTIWYLGYRLIFARTSFHHLNRAYLLIGILASVALPLMPATVATGFGIETWLAPVEIGSARTGSGTFSAPIIDLAYFLIVAFFLIRTGVSVVSAIWFDKKGSFSFFGRVVIEPGLTEAQRAQVYTHEMAHRKLGHSFDVLLIEVYKAIHWMNPVAWLYASSLKKIHEFQADQRVAQLGIDLHEYSVLLLSATLKLQPSALVNRFHQPSILKQRIIMLSTKSRNTRKYQYLLVIPLLAGALLLSSCSKRTADGDNAEGDIEMKVDKQAEFPGGMEAMFEWIGHNLTYPENLKEEGVEGKVIVKFIVQADGSVDTFSVQRGLHPVLDKLTVEVLSRMPNWSPAMAGTQAVSQEMVLPVVFKLD